MKYPFKVIVDGKVYGAADTLAEAQKVAKAQGGYVARIANPDVLTGKIRQREDGGHYVRTRKDKRPAEVDVTADQVAGDWRTQLAHSGHAPTPKPPKAPKVRATKAAKPDGRYRNQWAEMARLRVVEDDATRFEAMGATCTLVIRANPFETGAYLASLYDPQGRVLKQGSSGVGGTMDDALANLESGHAPAPKAPRAKTSKPKAPTPKTSAEIVAERFPNVSEARARTLAKAIDTGASESALEKLKAATRVEFADQIALPKGAYDHLSRGKGWARKGRGDSAEWGEKSPQGWLVGPGSWLVHSTDGFNRKSEVDWRVEHVRVGDETWTIAN